MPKYSIAILPFALCGIAAAQSDPLLVLLSGTPRQPAPVSFTASPNPVASTGAKTTLTWNAPGHSRVLIRVDEKKMTDVIAGSGSLETGNWVADGMVFRLID